MGLNILEALGRLLGSSNTGTGKWMGNGPPPGTQMQPNFQVGLHGIGQRPIPNKPITAPANRLAVPRELRGNFPLLPRPSGPSWPTFNVDNSGGDTVLMPGGSGPGLTYLNPTRRPIRGDFFTDHPSFTSYPIAPLQQSNLQQLNKLRQIQ